jgi:hypothetical protein
MIPDNGFSADTIPVRAERLQLIEMNIATHLPVLLDIDADLAARLANCSTVYLQKKDLASLADGESVGATTVARTAFDFLRKEYVVAKKYAENLYKNKSEFLAEYQFNLSYPTTQLEQLEKVRLVLGEHTRLIASGETPLLPEHIITRLTSALAAANVKFKAKAKLKGEATHAHGVLNRVWDTATEDLKTLYQSCCVTWDDDHINLIDLGFVRSSSMGQSGGGGAIPDTPNVPYFNGSTTLEWTPIDGATSYGIAVSTNGTDWQDDISSTTNSHIVPVLQDGKLWYKVRARNAGGMTGYSGILERLFGLAGVKNFTFSNGFLTWSSVVYAEAYQIERAVAGTSVYTLLFNTNGTSFSDSPAPGNWTYRIRAVNGGIFGEWAELNVNV